MDGISAYSGASSAEAMVLQNAETDTAKSVTLLKKTMQGEKDLVQTLLPAPGGAQMLDLMA